MKVDLMRERLLEAVTLASDEKIIQQFHLTTLEISRSEVLTLEDIHVLMNDAEADVKTSEGEPTDELLAAMIDRTKAALEAMQRLRARRAQASGKVVGM